MKPVNHTILIAALVGLVSGVGVVVADNVTEDGMGGMMGSMMGGGHDMHVEMHEMHDECMAMMQEHHGSDGSAA